MNDIEKGTGFLFGSDLSVFGHYDSMILAPEIGINKNNQLMMFTSRCSETPNFAYTLSIICDEKA
jgi:hypothetical protein